MRVSVLKNLLLYYLVKYVTRLINYNSTLFHMLLLVIYLKIFLIFK